MIDRNQGVQASIIPGLGTQLLGDTAHIWNYTTVPQRSLDNRTIAYPRGRLLGGSSSTSEPTMCDYYHSYLISLF